jgi:hypothetical protein
MVATSRPGSAALAAHYIPLEGTAGGVLARAL